MARCVIRSCHILGAIALLALGQPGHAAPAAPAAPGNAAVAAAPATEGVAKAKPAKATRIPEPGTPALFLLGAAGLVLGRRLSRSKRARSPEA